MPIGAPIVIVKGILLLASATSIALISIVGLAFPGTQQGAMASLLVLLILCPKAILVAFFIFVILAVAGSKLN